MFSKKASAACTYVALCDAPPGSCSTTCNGGQPCQINNGGYVEQCASTCFCSKGGTTCSVGGSLCNGSGSDPYNASSGDYGTCLCEEASPCVLTPTCTEVTWASCCTPGTPPPTGAPTCGNGSCGGAETCSNCPSDCGACPAVCGDGSCDGGETSSSCSADCGGSTCGNGSCSNGETCSSCPSDCGSCVAACGNGACNNGETCSSCPSDCGACANYCGNGTCAGSESCSNCAADCGACPDSCGDNACSGFETCESCPGDCGVCIEEGNQPWWQTVGGDIFAGEDTGTAISSDIYDSLCIEPDCIALLITPDLDGTADSDGPAITGGGDIDTNGFTNDDNTEATGTEPTRFEENFDYFYNNTDLGLNPDNAFIGQEGDILEPTTGQEVYYHLGDVTLQSEWTISAGEVYVIFIDGNLTITDPNNFNQLIDVENGGFIAFIVSGDIIITESVGNETLTDTTSNLEGVFIADGTITIESRGEAGGGDDRFVGEGNFIGHTGVELERDFSDGAGREVENQDTPTELFVFRPDLVSNVPDVMMRAHTIWQETN